MQNDVKAPAEMDLIFMILPGRVAFSPPMYWMYSQTIPVMAKNINRRTICPENQLYFTPPHCSAMKRHTIHTTKIGAPNRSSFLIFCCVVKLAITGLGGAVGWKKKTIPTKTRPPSGRLI